MQKRLCILKTKYLKIKHKNWFMYNLFICKCLRGSTFCDKSGILFTVLKYRMEPTDAATRRWQTRQDATLCPAFVLSSDILSHVMFFSCTCIRTSTVTVSWKKNHMTERVRRKTKHVMLLQQPVFFVCFDNKMSICSFSMIFQAQILDPAFIHFLILNFLKIHDVRLLLQID